MYLIFRDIYNELIKLFNMNYQMENDKFINLFN